MQYPTAEVSKNENELKDLIKWANRRRLDGYAQEFMGGALMLTISAGPPSIAYLVTGNIPLTAGAVIGNFLGYWGSGLMGSTFDLADKGSEQVKAANADIKLYRSELQKLRSSDYSTL